MTNQIKHTPPGHYPLLAMSIILIKHHYGNPMILKLNSTLVNYSTYSPQAPPQLNTLPLQLLLPLPINSLSIMSRPSQPSSWLLPSSVRTHSHWIRFDAPAASALAVADSSAASSSQSRLHVQPTQYPHRGSSSLGLLLRYLGEPKGN